MVVFTQAKQHVINALAILLLSGPTWIVGFLINVDPVEDGMARRVLGYVFVVFNSFQVILAVGVGPAVTLAKRYF